MAALLPRWVAAPPYDGAVADAVAQDRARETVPNGTENPAPAPSPAPRPLKGPANGRQRPQRRLPMLTVTTPPAVCPVAAVRCVAAHAAQATAARRSARDASAQSQTSTCWSGLAILTAQVGALPALPRTAPPTSNATPPALCFPTMRPPAPTSSPALRRRWAPMAPNSDQAAAGRRGGTPRAPLFVLKQPTGMLRSQLPRRNT